MITNYQTLQDAIAKPDGTGWTNRADLVPQVPTFIQLAESRIKRDERLRNQIFITFPITQREEDLPADFVELNSFAHDGPTQYFDLESVDPSQLPRFNVSVDVGIPRAVAIIDRKRAVFAPAPNDTFDLKLDYDQTISNLGGSVLTNWLLDEAPDVYLYASLIEAARYMQEDEDIQKYEAKYGQAVTEFHGNKMRGENSGPMRRKPSVPIGAFGSTGYAGSSPRG